MSNENDATEDIRDTLPHDLDAVGHRAEYRFPDNSRRRIPGVIYVLAGSAVIVVSALADDSTSVNDGLLFGGVLLVAIGAFSLLSGWRMTIDEQGALAAAGTAVGFAVGHASAQQVWRGIRSRPTWRVLCYSNEDPPLRRGLVLVDAVDGSVKEHFVEENLETWDDVGDR
jgi:hypothetical protein